MRPLALLRNVSLGIPCMQLRRQVDRKKAPLGERIGLRMSASRHLDGLWIGTLDVEEERIFARVEQALLLIRQFDALRYKRLTSDFERIWVRLLPAALASYHVALRTCQLDTRYVLADTTPVEMLAACIVHEATHARLRRCGIGYDEKLRQRVEEVCLRRELAFAARLPDGANVRQAAEEALQTPPEFWRDEAFNEHFAAGNAETLRYLGVPAWLIRSLEAVRRLRRWLRRKRP
jgi:hypothetical protein